MADLMLSSFDVATVRFQVSRLLETALSVRVLQHDPTGLHRAWVRQARERLTAQGQPDLAVLLALVPRSGYMADTLSPSHPGHPRSIADELATLRALDPALLVRDVALLRTNTPGPGAASEAVLRDLLRDPASGLERVAQAMQAWWELALADHWEPVRRLLQADITQRSARIAAYGLGPTLHELSPRVKMLGDRIRVERCREGEVLVGGRGLVLAPSVFAQPRGLSVLNEPFIPTVIYHALGVGNLWSTEETDTEHALDDALGHTRAQLLRTIGIPATTTELAGQLCLSAATVNAHLAILRRAGLADSGRDGREVLYRRTPVGDALLAASSPRPD